MEAIIRESYDVIIGLEVHVQLKTNSKIFSRDAAAYGQPPNTNVSVVTLGHPGTLPMLNKEVVAMGIKMALACHGEISRTQAFDRKNYFYPDLPKGYQITQDRTPLCRGGYLIVYTRNESHRIALEKIHMEEDAGKSIHREGSEDTWLDFNRAGTPLLEIVTKPVIYSAVEAAAFVSEIRKVVRYLDISVGNMEEGSLRCDANVSIKPRGTSGLGKKVEIKNLNSIRNLSHAIDHDVDRQIGLTEAGHPIQSETRTFDASSGKTYPMRSKEELNDYRYFPDPDLPVFHVSDSWIDEIAKSMPSLPNDVLEKFIGTYQLTVADALVLSESRNMVQYFEHLVQFTPRHKAAANWLIGPVKSYLNERGVDIDQFPVSSKIFSRLVNLVEVGKVSFSMAAQRIFPALVSSPERDPEEIAQELNLLQENDDAALERTVDEVIKEFPLKVEAFKNGKTGIVSMFMGEVMKRTKGKADPRSASEMIENKLLKK